MTCSISPFGVSMIVHDWPQTLKIANISIKNLTFFTHIYLSYQKYIKLVQNELQDLPSMNVLV